MRTVAVSALAAAALVASLATPVQADPAEPTNPSAVSSAAKAAQGVPLSRPDALSAGVTARASGQRVEVESLQDEFSSTFVNPDGSWTTDQHAGQQRWLEEPSGEWREVDLDLVTRFDGSVAPKGHPGDLVLSGGGGAGGSDLVSVKAPLEPKVANAKNGKAGRGSDTPAEREEFSLAWGKKLPKPVLEGQRATYPQVTAGVDLVVESRRSGFEQYFVINNPSALPVEGPVSWSFTLKTKGLTPVVEGDGSVSFTDDAGVVVSTVPAASAWDAQVDERSGEPANVSPVKLSVVTKGNTSTITVTPDQGWLRDPARVFPVTVDPTYAAGSVAPGFDTMVASNIANTDQSTDTELKIGTYDGGATKARSFINFPTTAIRGKQVQSASLSLYEIHSYSCTPTPIYVQSTAGVATPSTRWGSQPGVTGASSSASFAKGYSSACPGGRVNIPVTAQIQDWSGSTATTQGLRVSASETSSSGWKRFYSTEGPYDPVLSFTYNRKPNAATTPSVDNTGTYNSVSYAWKPMPTLRATATDPDANTVSFNFEVHTSTTASTTSRIATCASGFVASGSTAPCTLGTTLPNNTELFVRAAVKDSLGMWNGTWSPWKTLRTAQTAPAAPTITCPGYPTGSWNDDAPATAVDCTVSTSGSGYSAPTTVKVTVDANAPVTFPVAQTPTTKSFTVPNTEGGHTITAVTQNASTMISPYGSYAFGYGGASLSSPTAGDASNGKFQVEAVGPPRGAASGVSASLRWRRAGSGTETEGWNTAALPAAPAVTSASSTAPVSTRFVWDANTATSDASTSPATAVSTRLPARLDLQVCFTYTGVSTPQCTWSQSGATVVRMPHAFGNGFPVADAGPGQVALWTGEFNTSATDVTVPGYTGTLSLSRSHSTHDGPDNLAQWPSLPGSGVLGPGWTAQLDGSDVGDADLQVIDNSAADGSIAFVGSDGSASVFVPATGLRRTGATLATGDWVPGDEDTAASGLVLSVKDTAQVSGGIAVPTPGGTADLLLRSQDGTVTTFIAQAAPSTGQPGTFTPGLVDEPGQLGATTYSRDAQGRTTRILAPVPPGVTCPASGTLNPGCRALVLTYASADTTTLPRDVTGQLKSVALHAWDPDKAGGAGMATLPVATYGYDTDKRLVKVTDTRSGLATTYTYDGSTPRLASITPPGLAPFTLSYAANISPGLPKQLTAVSRPPADGTGGAAVKVAAFVYGIDPTEMGAAAGLPALAAADVQAWQQSAAPAYGAAVFGADREPGTHDAASVPAAAWPYADLQYTDANGYTTNTASYGAGRWQITAQDYDTHGNVIRSLDKGGIAAHLQAVADGGAAITPEQVSADPYATLTQYNTEEKLTSPITLADGTVLPAGHVIAAAGTRAVHQWGPARLAAVAGSDALVEVRPHTTSILDEGAPNAGIDPTSHQRYNLVTTETVGAASAETADTTPGIAIPADLEVLSKTINAYDPLEAGAAPAGPTSGWVLGSPTRITQVLAPGTAPATAGITRDTVYDTEGRVTQTRQPSESGGAALPPAGPGTRLTRYYTAAAQTAPTGDPACGSKPQWAGAECTVGPAAQPGGQPLATTRTGDFTVMLNPRTVTETSGPVTRTTSTGYDNADRPITRTTSVAGLSTAQSAPVPQTATAYSAATGLATAVTAAYPGGSVQTIQTGYDSWGRATTYTPEAGAQTTTSFDTAGRVSRVTDPTATTTYTYGTDSRGQVEHRGMPTAITTVTGGDTITVTGAYNADATLIEQQLPGGITRLVDVDAAGEVTGQSYTGSGPDGGPDVTWLAWSQDNDALGRVIREYTPNASVFEAEGDAAPYHRAYTYDGAARLTTVHDRTADPGAAALQPNPDPDAVQAFAACQRRDYVFDPSGGGDNGNRTSLARQNAAAGAPCPLAPTTQTPAQAWTYDAADRATATTGPHGTGSYTYDQLGRTLTLPAADTINPAGGDVTLGYYTDDAPWTITHGGNTQTHTYDAAGRRTSAVTTGTTPKTLTRSYTDTSDNPTWTTETIPANGSTPQKITATRSIGGLTGDLTATHTSTDGAAATELMLANPHGDIVSTITVPDTGNPTGITGWTNTDEFGNPHPGAATTAGATPAGYGWLGTKERSADTPAGLTLMGARLYNPTTGRFLTLDPIPGGGANVYSYPTDPINGLDLDGRFWVTVVKWGSKYGSRAAKWGWNKCPRCQKKVVGHLAPNFGKWYGPNGKLFGSGKNGNRKGWINKGPIRTGWGWVGSNSSGRSVFRTAWGWPKRRQTNAFKRWVGNHHRDWN